MNYHSKETILEVALTHACEVINAMNPVYKEEPAAIKDRFIEEAKKELTFGRRGDE